LLKKPRMREKVNKYIKIIVASFLLMCSHYGLGMQQRLSIPKAPPVLDRSFHKNQKALQHMRCEQHDLYAKAEKIFSLAKEEQSSVVNNLSSKRNLCC
jgi:hypothetical protein